MNKSINTIHPFNRLLFLAGSLIALLLFDSLYYLLGYYLFFILPLVFLLNLIRIHLRLFVFGITPIFFTFILLYIIVMKGTNGSWDFILLKCLKILGFTSVFQVALTIPSNMLFTTFKKWGFKGDSLLTLIGAFTVWADIKTRANQIITARFARGFIGKRNIINTAKQFPYVLIPLIIGVMRTSTERVEVWEQRNIPNLVDNQKVAQMKFPILINTLVVIIPLAVVLISIYLKYL